MRKWKTIIALFLLILAVLFEWNWFWAFFIFMGLVNVLSSKKIHFVEEVSLEESPRLYWTMVIIWSFLALFSILNYLDILT
ncbi:MULTISPECIES: hypothetical protein [Tenacibaculum]|uniref:hypothetical protein n=1 Tax=Tenacibaculum TaxID=104267 RepID=UPI001F47CE60|nr:MULTISPECIES: hypothetical protein [Tenacibaculum]MCF2873374.1 hypothetical protein [Tenacibaculum sp. Cn5-1]MCF2933530.1 hypothetical protein [Tenacibaculum sp. Cn5-34]MCG7509888.1 hypothetical protein [Tenacibaculum sp. Cn5-46]